MKKELLRRPFLLVILLSFFYSVTIYGQSRTQKIEKCINLFGKYNQYNGAILIVENNEVIYQKALGFANMELSVPVTFETRFRIGSITKTFTSILIFQAIEKGLLKLEGKVQDYLPEFPKAKGEKMTINHLLTHTAGLRDISDFPRNRTDFPPIVAKINAGYLNNNELTSVISEYDLLFEPGTDFRYSNDGYILLGRILEKVSEKTYAQLLTENILIPAQMKNSGMVNSKTIIKHKASGYDQTFKGYENAAQIAATPASGMYSTIGDLLLFQRAFDSGKLVSNDSKKTMLASSPNVVAYGWKVRNIKDENTAKEKLIIMTDGSLPGFTSFMVNEVEEKRLFIFLTNTREMTHKIVDVYVSVSNILNNKSYNEPKQSLAESLVKTIINGDSNAIVKYSSLVKDPTYYLSENEMNSAGYFLLNSGQVAEAVKLFKLNTEAFPNSANAFDSLGESYMIAGDKENAIANYKKSLDLNPKNSNAEEMLKKLSNHKN
ncbi:MAG: serine hydrolase [Bacteroidetes bacterium]|nr:serine hydrolase [Bacteroidota bacterium]